MIIKLSAEGRSLPLIDLPRDLVSVATIRARCGFYDLEPPYQLDKVRDDVFRHVRITGVRLPVGVLARIEVGVGDPIILYNDAELGPARRFGIAHEFAHLCIDPRLMNPHDYQARDCRRAMRSNGDEMEQRCDLWAAELLAPLAVVDRYAPDELNLNPTTKAAKRALQDLIDRLAEKFGVSESVIALRLRDLVALRQSSLFLR